MSRDKTGDQARLPVEIEEITPRWLGEALSIRHPGTEVSDVEVLEVLEGTATKVRVALTYDGPGEEEGLPPALCVKGGFGPQREFAASLGIYENEARFFLELQPDLPVRTPRCYFAGIDAERGQGVLLLEDLVARKVSFGRATRPITPDAAAATLDAQARFHAHWWNSPRLDEILSYKKPQHPEAGGFSGRMLQPEIWAEYMAKPRGAALPVVLHDRERMIQAMVALREVSTRTPRCLNHGDAHLGNMYFEPDGTPGFLDWQCTRAGPWIHDVTYFLVSALDIPDRRRSERELLAHYLKRLEASGVEAPTFEEAWLAHRRQVLHGLFAWMMNPEEFQPEDVNAANATRFAIAAIDLETFESLL